MTGDITTGRFTQDELKILLKKAQNGDMNARERMVSAHLALVHSIARRYCYSGRAEEDIFQAGCIGLLQAIDRFDFSYDVCFSTYAVPLILGEIRRFIREDHPIKVSRQLRERAAQIDRCRHALYSMSGTEPSLVEIAECCDLSREQAVAALNAVKIPVSISEPRKMPKGESGEIGDFIKSNDGKIDEDVLAQIELKQAIERLPERLGFIIQCRYFRGMTQREVAAVLGVTQVQISRLEKKALTMIRKAVDDVS